MRAPRLFVSLMVLLVAFSAGAVFGSVFTSSARAEVAPQAAPPAYMVGVSRALASDPAAMAAYRDWAVPLATAAGFEDLASTAWAVLPM